MYMLSPSSGCGVKIVGLSEIVVKCLLDRTTLPPRSNWSPWLSL